MRAAMRYLIAAGYLVMILGGGAVFLASRHFHVYSFEGWQVYGAMGRECHPAWADYNFRRIRAGHDVDEVIARTNPITLERKGRWVVLGYQPGGHFTGMTAIACDGKIIFACAWSCSWTRLFFDEVTEEERMEVLGLFQWDPHWKGIVPVFRS